MSFFLFEFDNASFYLEREKTQEELIRDRKLSELTNALFEVSNVTRLLYIESTDLSLLKNDNDHYLKFENANF